jgi:tetratricopeptide (TPR) repeat protein
MRLVGGMDAMRQIRWVVALTISLLVWSHPSLADRLADCRQSDNQKQRIASCTEVIEAVGLTSGDRAAAYRIRGRLRADAGALDQAFADLSEAIKLDSTDAVSLIARAFVRIQQRDLNGAIVDFSAAIVIRPRSAFALSGRGHAYMLKGDTTRALEDLSTVIAIVPESARAYNNRGLAHRKAGDLVKAISDYTSAIVINPIYALAYANRGYAFEARGEKQKAIGDFRSALLLDPSLSAARDSLVRLGASGELIAESERLVDAGREIAQANCAACHGIGKSTSSPNPRAPTFQSLHARHPWMALREPLTRGLFAPHDEMPKFALSNSQIDSIVSYINSLPSGR